MEIELYIRKQTYGYWEREGRLNWEMGIDMYTLCVCVCVLSRFSHVQLCGTQWTVAHQAPLSMEFSRREYWNGLPCLPLGDLPEPGVEPGSPVAPAGGFFTVSHRGRPICPLLYIKLVRVKDPLYGTGNSSQYSVLASMGKESKKE